MEVFGDRRAEMLYIQSSYTKFPTPTHTKKKKLKIESSPPGSDSSYPVK